MCHPLDFMNPNEKYTEQVMVDIYYCRICECYYDSTGREVNTKNMESYNTINDVCRNCLTCSDFMNEQDEDMVVFYNYMKHNKNITGNNWYLDNIYLPIMKKLFNNNQ